MPCERCKGEGRHYIYCLDSNRKTKIRCSDCDGHGVTARPNLLAAQTQLWMVREKKWPQLYTDADEQMWEWWDSKRLASNSKHKEKHSDLPHDVHSALANRKSMLCVYDSRLAAESALQVALLHLSRIAATGEVLV